MLCDTHCSIFLIVSILVCQHNTILELLVDVCIRSISLLHLLEIILVKDELPHWLLILLLIILTCGHFILL